MPELYTAPALSRLCGIFLNLSLYMISRYTICFIGLPRDELYYLDEQSGNF